MVSGRRSSAGGQPHRGRPPAAGHRLLAAALVILTGLLSFWNGLSGPFIFDDYFSITSNHTLESLAASLAPPAGSAVAGRPIVNLSRR